MSFIGDLLKANILVDGKNYSFAGGGQLRNSGPVLGETTVTTITDAGDVTFTADQILGGLILRDPAGGARADLVPTAVNLVDGIEDCRGGDSFLFMIRNDADAAEAITLTTNTGATLSGTMTIAQNNTKIFLVVVDDASEGNEAYTVYSIGTLTH